MCTSCYVQRKNVYAVTTNFVELNPCITNLLQFGSMKYILQQRNWINHGNDELQ